MADINVLDLTPTTPGSNDSLILFDRTTGEGKSTRFDTLSGQVLDSKFGDSNPTAGQELSYNPTTGKYENTSQIASLNEALTNEVTTRVINGAHNLLKNEMITQTQFGLTFTVDSAKGTIAVSGAKSDASGHGLNLNTSCPLKKGRYIVTDGQSNSNIGIIVYNASTLEILADTRGSSNEFTLSTDINVLVKVYFTGAQNYTFSTTLYPMIRLATDADPTYQPYAMTNRELTKESEVIDNSANLVINTTNFDITGLSDQNTLFKVGNIVEVNVVGHCKSSATNTAILLATIPEGYRPKSFPSISSYINGAVTIGIDKYTGALTMYSAQSQENWVIRAHFTYVCQ